MVAPPFVPECITPKLAHGNEGEATPTTTVGILHSLIYGGDSTDFKPTRGLILTWRFGWSHLEVRGGSVTGTTAGIIEGLLDFCKNINLISYQLIKCIRLA